MKCPFKDNQCNHSKVVKCGLAVFATIFVVALGLKIITLILSILPGSIYGNTWLVIVATLTVLFATKCCKKNKSCDCNCNKCDCSNCNCSNCKCPCHEKEKNQECCGKE